MSQLLNGQQDRLCVHVCKLALVHVCVCFVHFAYYTECIDPRTLMYLCSTCTFISPPLLIVRCIAAP